MNRNLCAPKKWRHLYYYILYSKPKKKTKKKLGFFHSNASHTTLERGCFVKNYKEKD